MNAPRPDALRTPDTAFASLPGYPFAPHYVDDLPGYEGLRLHYLDEGPRAASVTFLCLHGQPTWSYLYRKMIPVFAAANHRVIAPDWFGFGRSDKPTVESVYTFEFHRDTLLRLIERLELRNITLVCQDWGGLIGLTVPMDMPERFTRLLVMNTALATGHTAWNTSTAAFMAWRAYSNANPNMDVAALMRRAVSGIHPDEAAAYEAPFPDAQHKAGVRRFPNMVPTRPDTSAAQFAQRATEWWFNTWAGESFMAVGMKDPILGAGPMRALRSVIRGCPPPLEVAEAGHFVQESGDQIARAALKAFKLEIRGEA